MKIRSNKNQVMTLLENRAVYAHFLFGQDVKKKAKLITPLKDDHLRQDVRVRSSGWEGWIKWQAPYAQYQERGMRADGTRVVKNYTTPGTGPWYAYETVHKVFKNIAKYWQDANEAIG